MDTLKTISDSTTSLGSTISDTLYTFTNHLNKTVVELHESNSGYWDMQFKDWISFFAVVLIPLSIFLLQAKEKANKENGLMKLIRSKSLKKLQSIKISIETELISLKQTVSNFASAENVHIEGQVITIPFVEFKQLNESVIEDVFNYRLKNKQLINNNPIDYGVVLNNLYESINVLENIYKKRLDFCKGLSKEIKEFNHEYFELLNKIILIIYKVKLNEENQYSQNLSNVADTCYEFYIGDDKNELHLNFDQFKNNVITPFAKVLQDEYPKGSKDFNNNETLKSFWDLKIEWLKLDMRFGNFYISSRKKLETIIPTYEKKLSIINEFIKLHEHSTYKKIIFSF